MWGLAISEFHQPSATSQSASVQRQQHHGLFLRPCEKEIVNLQTTFDVLQLGRLLYILSQKPILVKKPRKNWKLLDFEGVNNETSDATNALKISNPVKR